VAKEWQEVNHVRAVFALLFSGGVVQLVLDRPFLAFSVSHLAPRFRIFLFKLAQLALGCFALHSVGTSFKQQPVRKGGTT
jgi:hypothetical protein